MKILFIRFSSIGDIVLTTPLLRCTKSQVTNVEIHFVTKKKFATVIASSPYIDKLYTIDESVSEISAQLKGEKYDFIADLHTNIRSYRLKNAVGAPSVAFSKLNFEKWLLVQFKINRLPDVHIVDRYFETLKSIGVKNDQAGLDYFIPEKDEIQVSNFLPPVYSNGFHTLVVGGSYYTKQIPPGKLKQIIERSDLPLVLLGGKEEEMQGQELQAAYPEKVYNCCGRINLNQSASLIRQCKKVITSDTGLMHIAAAFKKEIHSLWGNTVKEFGMYPYLPGPGSVIHEVTGLKCRPCSKLGYKKCPKGHFRCMQDINTEAIFS